MCKVLKVSSSGYYYWHKHPVSARQLKQDQLLDDIRQVHTQSQSRYGSPRIADELRERGVSHEHSYKGYAFDDDTTTTEDGRYRARVILKTIGQGRPPSQRFIDLETFAKVDDARQRAIATARAWIDEEQKNDKLALPTNFSPWC